MNILEWAKHIVLILCFREEKTYDYGDEEITSKSIECHDAWFGLSTVGSKLFMKGFKGSMTFVIWSEYGAILQVRRFRKEEQLWDGVSQVVLVVKNPPANAGDTRDVGLIPGSGRYPRGGHGNPTCLENLMDRGAWQATVHGVAKSRTHRSNLGHTQHSDSTGFGKGD